MAASTASVCSYGTMCPAFGIVEPVQLAGWLLESGLQIRMQLQLHKYIWDPQARGV